MPADAAAELDDTVASWPLAAHTAQPLSVAPVEGLVAECAVVAVWAEQRVESSVVVQRAAWKESG